MLTNNKQYPSTDLTVKQTALILQVTVHTIYNLLSDGRLESYRISERGTRISQAQLDRFRNNGGA